MRILTPDVERLCHMYIDEPEALKSLWAVHVGVPLKYGTAAEILNVGMRFAGHSFIYDAETFTQIAADCGFNARQVTYRQSEHPELQGLDLRSPQTAISLYFECEKT